MTVVVTGATGHVGATLVRALRAAGRPVRALAYDRFQALEGVEGVELVRGVDVRNRSAVQKALQGAEVVYHLAARISISGEQGGLVSSINVNGARNVAECALEAGVRRMVHCSSIHSYRIDGKRSVDEYSARSDVAHSNAYDRSKWNGERAVRSVLARGLDVVIVNPTSIAGPNDFGPSRQGQGILDLANGTLPALIEGGFDFIDVRDLVHSMQVAETRGRTGENYILNGRWCAFTEIADLVEQYTGTPKPRVYLPLWVRHAIGPVGTAIARVTGRDQPFTTEAFDALGATKNISGLRAQTELGHTPRPLAETVRDLLLWFQEQGKLRKGVRVRV